MPHIPGQRKPGETGGDPEHIENRLAAARKRAEGSGGGGSSGSSCLVLVVAITLVSLLPYALYSLLA